MIKQYFKIDENGNIIGSYVLNHEVDEIPSNYKEGWGDRRFYQPKWDFNLNDWVENLSEEEINASINQPRPPTDKERLESLENAILSVLMEG